MRRTEYDTGKVAKPGMTVGDLRRFLASLDGAPDDAVPKVRIYLGGGIQSMKVTEEAGR